MMDAVKAGGDRQELHEKIRVASMAAGRTVKEEGKPNDLLARLAADPAFGRTEEELMEMLVPKDYVGRAKEQTEEYLDGTVRPMLDANVESILGGAEIKV